MRKKHGFMPKIPRCSGPDSHNEQTPTLKVPLQTELRFHSRRYEQPPTSEGLRDDNFQVAHRPVREVGLRLSSPPAPARMMKILEAEGGAEVVARLASPHH
jgi:hypothetical protein